MATPSGAPALDSTSTPLRRPGWAFPCSAAVLILVAWLVAQYSPVPKGSISTIHDVSFVYGILVAGALPWFLQWAGISCVILYLWRRDPQKWKGPALFAILFSLISAAIWWSGLVFKFWGMDPLDALLDVLTLETAMQLGGGGTFDFFLFNFFGPIIGPIGLQGPINLSGLNFVSAMASTVLLSGYLLLIGRLFRAGSKNQSVKNQVKLVAAMQLCFLPSFIRIGMQIVQILTRPGF